MQHRLRASALLVVLCGFAASVRAEILVRWDQSDVPPTQSLGISTLVVPATHTLAVQNAYARGYRLYLEVDASAVPGFVTPVQTLAGVVVKGSASPLALRQLRQRLEPRGIRVVALEERGKWPHIRSNWVTKNNDLLQITGRSAQPWIENNAALLRIVDASNAGSVPMLTYLWTPVTLADKEEGPRLENYLVAIAEAGSFGADLLLPLHERFQARLLLGQPEARAEWAEIRRYVEFYTWNVTRRYEPVVNIGVVTAEPMLSFEVMNLLARHNLPFELISLAEVSKKPLSRYKLLVLLDEPAGAQLEALTAFELKGGKVSRQKSVADPNAFALEMRRLVGREHRVVDIWNGITVLTAPYAEPNGTGALLTVLNYAHQSLPVQLRIAGTYRQVQFETPENPAVLLPHQNREGFTEFVLPALRIGGRVFLSR